MYQGAGSATLRCMTISPRALTWTAVAGVVIAAWLFVSINANMFATYDLYADEYVGGPPAWVALIPLAIGVAAGIAALRASREASQRSTQGTDRP